MVSGLPQRQAFLAVFTHLSSLSNEPVVIFKSVSFAVLHSSSLSIDSDVEQVSETCCTCQHAVAMTDCSSADVFPPDSF